MKTITIEGQIRTEFGKSATRQLRLEEKVPAVIYGGAKEINFAAPATAFKNMIRIAQRMIETNLLEKMKDSFVGQA